MTAAPVPAGSLGQCWRYPVKSFQGMAVPTLELTASGVTGDRRWGLVPVDGDRVCSAKRHRELLEASATDTHLTLPDGTVVEVEDPEVHDRLSSWMGRPVRLATPAEAGSVSYEMTFDPPDDEAELFEIPTPDGTFLDLFPLHLVTTATLRGAADARPDLDWDVRRFRPNLLLEVDGPMFVEDSWAGRHLQVGEAVIRVEGPTVRCAMPLRAQPGGLARQPELYRAMVELNPSFPNHLGVYASVVTPGTVRTGDPVLVD